MGIVAKILIGAAVLGFLLAAVGTTLGIGNMFGVTPEGFSRGCSNLALLAIALTLIYKK